MLSTAANMESVLYRCLVRAFCVFLPVAWKLHEVICPLQILSVLENSRKAGSENTLSDWAVGHVGLARYLGASEHVCGQQSPPWSPVTVPLGAS